MSQRTFCCVKCLINTIVSDNSYSGLYSEAVRFLAVFSVPLVLAPDVASRKVDDSYNHNSQRIEGGFKSEKLCGTVKNKREPRETSKWALGARERSALGWIKTRSRITLRTLGGGQKPCLAAEPKVLLFDEPAANMDPQTPPRWRDR